MDVPARREIMSRGFARALADASVGGVGEAAGDRWKCFLEKVGVWVGGGGGRA